MNLTHHTETVYEKILHKSFDNDLAYTAGLQTRIDQMVSEGKTDGIPVFSDDNLTIFRNFTSLEAANEWSEFVYEYNSDPAKNVTIVRSIVVEGAKYYQRTPTDADKAARLAAALAAKES